MAGGRTAMCFEHHAYGSWGEGHSGEPPTNRYNGPAIVTLDTKIYAQPGSGEWAFVRKNIEVTVRYDEREPWVELRSIPGMDGSPPTSPWLHAYVHVRSVIFPGGHDKQPGGG